MIENKNLKFPISDRKSGVFGFVRFDTSLTDSFFEHKLAFRQEIIRCSFDKNIELSIISSLDNTEELLSIKPQIRDIDEPISYWETSIWLEKKRNDCQFNGYIGVYRDGSCQITVDIYTKIRAKIIEICNPELDYEINDIIDLLRQIEEPEANFFTTWWDKLIGIKQEKCKVKVKDDNI